MILKYFFYIFIFILLCLFVYLICFNFKNYNHDEIIKKDLSLIKEDEIYKKLIQKNLEQIFIKGKINIEGILEDNEQLKLMIQEKKLEIQENDFENKINDLNNKITEIIKENDQLNRDLEELKQDIKNILSGTNVYINKTSRFKFF